MKTYENLQQIFADELFNHSEILVFWGKRRKGKSSLKARFEVDWMQPRNAKADVRECAAICEQINQTGLNLHPPKDHLVFVNTYAESIGPHLKKTKAYTFKDIEFGLPNATHPTGLLVPIGKYSFDESQDLFDSHMGQLATFVSKGVELSGQIGLTLMIAVQRPKRVPQDIRDLATFIECISFKEIRNKYGRIVRDEWVCNIIYDNANLEAYLGSRDKKYVDKTVKFVFNGNIRRCYNHRYFALMFYKRYEKTAVETDFTLERCSDVEYTPNGAKKYFDNHSIEIPETYRGKKKKETKS